MGEHQTTYSGLPCQAGGPHYFATPERCLCGLQEGYVMVKRSEYRRLIAFAKASGYESALPNPAAAGTEGD